MQYFSLLALSALAAAAPLNERAGGAGAPAKVALPKNCPIKSSKPTSGATNFAPVASYASQALYTYTLSPGSTLPSGTNDTEAVNDCLQTCYGYGNPGDCTAVWTAHGANVQEFGSTVYAEFVCKLFKGGMAPKVLGKPNKGDEDANAHGLTIGCGARAS